MTSSLSRRLFAVYFLVAALNAAAAPILTNGSFEESPLDPGPLFSTRAAGDTAITGWTIPFGTIDFISGQWLNSHGLRSVDLNGISSGAIAQTFDTVAGQTYEIGFDFAGNPGGGPPVKSLQVQVAGVTRDFTFDITGFSFTNMGWRRESFFFTADSTRTTLLFASIIPEQPEVCCWGPVIDNVLVTSIPEPSVFVLVSTGTVLVCLGRFRRRKSVR